MKILNTQVGKFGPFSVIETLDDRYRCDDMEYQFSVIGDTTIENYTESPNKSVLPPPDVVSPRQIRQALTRAGLRVSVEAAIAAGDQDTKDWYEYATAFERTNTHVILMGELLGVSDDQLDDLWRLAGSL